MGLASHALVVPAAQDQFVAALEGEWAGTLEYADYSDDARAQIVVRVVIHAGELANSAELQFTFVEPDGEEMLDSESVRLDAVNSRYHVGEEDFEVAALTGFQGGDGEVVWTGSVRENGATEPFRQTLSLVGDTLTILKETREPLRFRNVFRLERVR
jgi:hypothetical protein